MKRLLCALQQWQQPPPIPADVPDYVAAVFTHADQPQSSPPAGLAGRLSTLPGTPFSHSTVPAPAQTANAGGLVAFAQLSATSEGPPAAGWDAVAAAASADDPIKQVQMRFRARASPPHPRKFTSLSFPAHGMYPALGPPWQQPRQQQTPAARFHSVSQDSVMNQYRQQVRRPAAPNNALHQKPC